MPKVKAIKMGFYRGARKRPGEVFDVDKGEKASWFVPTDEAPTGPKARGRVDSTSSTEQTSGSGSSGEQAGDDLQ
ncbi:hypothetical protein [Burkholderia vietnamiensis]|uniref:hypothetical protein n=1 Tax=Burkholderia vietnamiensis TaxID=60552 RepID=UPI00075EF565|nr:hypothetical protein [Burkholderia vietnamiensis]KVE99266.1 hypothetical protein WJ03_13260 [Burkholderia vietnamiensis]MBR8083079.1 hypothetical protein [Burkholderia vietnamiensis]MCA8267445.1 hypothetical protein [Burkholderia vietnamiensis]HEP6279810.1 hypothetical protein [Burkholderia vietnamiensis]HEP6287882.1 hypothetical protein [Burkholderia vietnamiensis]